MDIRVEGNRSTVESWARVRNISPRELPSLSPEEKDYAAELGLSAEDFARDQLAADLSREELGRRAEIVGRLVDSWFRRHGILGQVKEVWLMTFLGKFRVGVEMSGGSFSCLIEEDVITSLLEAGSQQAEQQLERLLTANFGLGDEAKAS